MNPNPPSTLHGTSHKSDNPLDQILQEHLRQREICAKLDRLANLEQSDSELAVEVLPHFDTLLARHVHDEEDDLYPLLRRRSDPDDDINETLDRLMLKHQISLKLAVRVKAIVTAMARDSSLPDADEAAALIGFAAHERRHLIVENAIVLPMARARLTNEDLAELRARMKKRRADPPSKGQSDAE